MGNESNCHALELLTPGPRTQLVTLGCGKKRHIQLPAKYQHFLETGSDKLPRVDEADRDRNARATLGAGRQREDSRHESSSSSRHESHSRHHSTSSSTATPHARRDNRHDRYTGISLLA